MGQPRPPRIGDRTSKGIGFVAYCGGCGRQRHYDAETCNRLFGANSTVHHARERLRCGDCGTRGSHPPGITLHYSLADFAGDSLTRAARELAAAERACIESVRAWKIAKLDRGRYARRRRRKRERMARVAGGDLASF